MAEITKKPVELAHVGFRAILDLLNNPDKYPTFLRVNPTISEVTQSILGFMERTYSRALYWSVSPTAAF